MRVLTCDIVISRSMSLVPEGGSGLSWTLVDVAGLALDVFPATPAYVVVLAVNLCHTLWGKSMFLVEAGASQSFVEDSCTISAMEMIYMCGGICIG